MHEPNPGEVRDDLEQDFRERATEWYPSEADSDTVIWRYMDLGKFISLIQNDQIWFANKSMFDDPYEGRYSKSAVENMLRERWNFDSISEGDLEFFVENGYDPYVSCWNMKETQSVALWKLYTEGNDGVAIKSTVGALKEAITWFSEEELSCQIESGKVKYHITGDEPAGYYAPIFTKRDIYEFESEYRIVLTPSQSLEGVDIQGTKIKPGIGIGVEIDTDELVDEVYISPSASGYMKEVVENLRAEFGPDYSIERSTINDHPLVDN